MSDSEATIATYVATDGSCLKNPGPGGWAWVTADGRSASGSRPEATNNLMELRAVYEALALDEPLVIQTDSRYVIDIFTKWIFAWRKNGWRTKDGKPVANQQAIEWIWARLSARSHRTQFQHVYGHKGHPLNERADKAARDAAKKQSDPTPAKSP